MSGKKRRPLERITFNGETLDEVVIDGSVHIEALSVHDYMIIIDVGGGQRVHLQGKDVWLMESEGVDDLIKIGPPLLGCRHEWTRAHLKHECVLDPNHVGKHMCDCQDNGKRQVTGERRSAPCR